VEKTYLLILEAMKMEQPSGTRAGPDRADPCRVDEQVGEGTELIEFEAES